MVTVAAALAANLEKLTAAGVNPVAIKTFEQYFRQVANGATGMIPETTIAPLELASLAEVSVTESAGEQALARTAVVKLNGGLGTSMGMDRAKSLLCVREGLSFLDISVRQILELRKQYRARLPLLFMNSFRTSADTLNAVARYPDLPVEDLPLEFLQNKEPKLLQTDLTPVAWPRDPSLEWCPPGHGEVFATMASSGVLAQLAAAGFTQVFISNSDNLGGIPDPKLAGWFADSGAPFAVEAVRRTPNDRKGGHFATRLSDGRIILREIAQTLPADLPALADLDRHKYTSTNNLWFNIAAMQAELAKGKGVLQLPLIRNEKTVDPTDSASPRVIQLESAMGSAIEIFDGAQTIEVTRARMIPVKSTNELLLLRSDVYKLGTDYQLTMQPAAAPFVDLDPVYRTVTDFDQRFTNGAPSLAQATSFEVIGDWEFGADVTAIGAVKLVGQASRQQVKSGAVLTAAD